MRMGVAVVVIGSVVAPACATDDAERATTSATATVATSVPSDTAPEGDGADDEADHAATTTDASSPVEPVTTVQGSDGADAIDPLVEEGRDHVVVFLDHLAERRYAEAATMLGGGGLDAEQRSDLAALGEIGEGDASLASSLATWCDIAMCEPPSDVTARADDRRLGAIVTATWGAGDAVVSATFRGHTWEGAPAVRGVPPVTGVPAVAVTADLVGATTIVAEPPGSGVVSWVDGDVFQVSPRDDVVASSDGRFVFWSEWDVEVDDGVPAETSFAFTLEGEAVCEVSGRIHRLRETAEGAFVASVEREDEPPPRDVDEWPIPNFAVRCETGEETAIDPVSFRREGGGRSTEVIAGRVFTWSWDAEGNADVVNDDGVSVNGEDYAGWHVFSPDAGLVAYGDYGSGNPHETDTIRVRDTVDGAERWSTELERSFNRLIVTEDRVIVGLPPERVGYEFWSATESIAVFDLETGERLATIPTDVDLLHAS